jgi:hypothetical protein
MDSCRCRCSAVRYLVGAVTLCRDVRSQLESSRSSLLNVQARPGGRKCPRDRALSLISRLDFDSFRFSRKDPRIPSSRDKAGIYYCYCYCYCYYYYYITNVCHLTKGSNSETMIYLILSPSPIPALRRCLSSPSARFCNP